MLTENILNYFFRNFKANSGIDLSQINLGYGSDGGSSLEIRQGNLDYFSREEAPDISSVIWKEWKGEKLPFLFDMDGTSEIITRSGDQVIINYDIIASAFFFLSNWQEYVSSQKDNYGRFKMTDSIQYKLGITGKPLVNYYFDILKDAVESAFGITPSNPAWGGKKFAVCLTHDIDLCESAWIQGSFREFKRGHFLAPFILMFRKFFSKDAWFNFDEILDTEKEYNAKSTFFFLPFKGKKNGILNADYDVSGSEFKKLFRDIKERGSEIGIHGSIGTDKDSSMFREEMEKIGEEIKGNRFHFLMYDSHVSVGVLADSGLKYDSTLGFAETIGFRNSYCMPFFLFDIRRSCSSDVVEIPLLAMDASFTDKYMGVNKEEALQHMTTLLAEVEKFSGCFTILWHNTYFSEYKYGGWKAVYCRFLELCASKDALMTSGENIYDLFISENKP